MNIVTDGSAKRVLVAGASGYIGRAVAAELIERGYFVYVIVRQNTKFAQSNASNLTVLSVDIVENTEDTMTLLGRYVDESDTPLKKDRLKENLAKLYHEAQDLEL